MTVEQVTTPKPRATVRASSAWSRLLIRGLVVLAVAIIFARLAGRWMRFDVHRADPAGWGRGFVHGAIMPLAMPGLLLGNDPIIYAEHNAGRIYKLGYTMGVDLCGAGFFGWSFWRWSRWRTRR